MLARSFAANDAAILPKMSSCTQASGCGAGILFSQQFNLHLKLNRRKAPLFATQKPAVYVYQPKQNVVHQLQYLPSGKYWRFARLSLFVNKANAKRALRSLALLYICPKKRIHYHVFGCVHAHPSLSFSCLTRESCPIATPL